MRIALLVRDLSRGGLARQVVYLARGLQARNHDVTIMELFGSEDWDDELEGTGIARERIGIRGHRDVLVLLQRTARRLRALEPEVIYGFYAECNILALGGRALTGAPVVFGLRTDSLDPLEGDRVGRATAVLHRRLLGRADLIVANSERGADAARALGHPVRVIPNGVDTETFAPDPAARAALRRTWQLEDDAPAIGVVARLEPRKGHERFLHAASAFARDVPSARFLLVGGGSPTAEARLRALASSLGIADQTIFAGPRSDVAALYNALDLTSVLSPWGEGIPNVVLESLATGVPCVVNDVGDAPLVVAEPSAVVPPAAAAETVAAAWKRRLDEWSAERGAAERQRIAAAFSIETLVTQTEAALAALL